MIVRPTARAIVVDPAGRVLLFHCVFESVDANPRWPRTFWVLPGGGVEAGETFEQAALREVFEETGIPIGGVGPCLLEREDVGRHPDFGEQDILYRGRVFIVRVSAAEAASVDLGAVERAGYREHRWWTLDELGGAEEPVFPEELVTILRGVDVAASGFDE